MLGYPLRCGGGGGTTKEDQIVHFCGLYIPPFSSRERVRWCQVSNQPSPLLALGIYHHEKDKEICPAHIPLPRKKISQLCAHLNFPSFFCSSFRHFFKTRSLPFALVIRRGEKEEEETSLLAFSLGGGNSWVLA